jgi:hypothetical protein
MLHQLVQRLLCRLQRLVLRLLVLGRLRLRGPGLAVVAVPGGQDRRSLASRLLE